MSLLPAGALSYSALVSEFFLQLRGSGLLLSPLDQELVAEWERRGVPAAVVCRGLRRGFEELSRDRPAGSAPPRALRALRGFVEEEWRAYRDGRVGDGGAPEPEAEAAARRLEAARAHLAEAADAADAMARSGGGPERDGRGGAYREAAARLPASVGTLDDLDRALREADDLLLHRWVLSLPRPERAALGPRCRLLAGERTRRARRSSYRHALRTQLFEAARRAGILCLHGTV
ncbi:MAG TPA: hypothetical protein VFM53_03020 [Anaeromyxobacteraceae bacterium]|nr:hypothetical protein [Anaeromyxobacteraceae bacterium]